MPINEPTDQARLPPFLTAQPVVEFWDTTGTPQWRTFALGRMYLDRLVLRLFNQGVSEAILRYECGEISFEGGAYGPIQPLALDRVWIRVTVTTDDTNIVNGLITPAPKTVTWAGIVTRTEEINRATTGGPRLITQRFTAKGMEFLLSRRQIVTAEVHPDIEIPYGLTFNAHSDRMKGSRRTVKGNKQAKTRVGRFSEDDKNAEKWNGQKIVEYLERTQFPTGQWTWFDSNLSVMKWIEPVIECHGKTVFDVLTGLASARRGLGSHIFYTVGASNLVFGSFTYRADSMFTSNTRLPSGAAIDANANIVNLVTSSHRDAFTTINTDSSRRYDKVVATGAREGRVASWSWIDGTLETAWTAKDRNAYKTGSPLVTGTDPSRIRDEHDRYRRQKLPQVFTRFNVPLSFGSRVGNGEGQRGGFLTRRSNIDPHEIYVKEMRFASYIPMNVGWDYGGSRTPVATASAPLINEFRKPFLLFKVSDLGSPNQWEYGHELRNIEDETIGENGLAFSCIVRPLDRQLGISVRPSVAAHVMSTGMTSEKIDTDTSDKAQNQVDYRAMIFTGYTQLHSLVKGEYPKVTAEAEHTHFLRLGETAFHDVIVRNTVIDVIGGELQRTSRYVTLRDDRKYLEDVARIAWQWYGFDRVASQIRYRQITAGASRGNLIGTLDDVTANAIVSSVQWDFTQQTTEIFTHFAEPDFAELAAR